MPASHPLSQNNKELRDQPSRPSIRLKSPERASDVDLAHDKFGILWKALKMFGADTRHSGGTLALLPSGTEEGRYIFVERMHTQSRVLTGHVLSIEAPREKANIARTRAVW